MSALGQRPSEAMPNSAEDCTSTSGKRYWSAALTAAANLIGRPLNLAMSLTAVGIAVRSLGPDRYGIWINCYTLSLWFSIFECGVASSLLNRLACARAQNDQHSYRKAITTANRFLWSIGVTVFTLIGILAVFSPLPELLDPKGTVLEKETRACMLVFGAFAAALIPLQLYDRVALAHQEGWLNVVAQVLASALALLAVAVATCFSNYLPHIAGAWVLGSLTGMLAIRSAIRKRYGDTALTPVAFCRSELQALLSTGFWFVLASFAGQLAMQSDPLILTLTENLTGQAVGPAIATDLAVPMRLFNVVNAFAILAINPLWPAYADAAARGDIGWSYRTLVASTASAVALSLIAVTPCVVFGDQLLALWVGDTVQVAPSLLRAYAFWTVTMVATHSLSVFCQGNGMLRFSSLTSTAFLLVALPAKLIGLSLAGPTGLVAATTVAAIGTQTIPLLASIAFDRKRPRITTGASPQAKITRQIASKKESYHY